MGARIASGSIVSASGAIVSAVSILRPHAVSATQAGGYYKDVVLSRQE